MNTATLTALFPKRQLALNPAELLTYEVDAGYDRGRPDGVFFPESTEDVSLLVRWAAPQHVPVIARGAGTGLSGGAVPEHGGIVVSLARMNHVVELDPVGRSAVVQVGVVNLAFDGLVKEQGLYYPPDPSSGRSSLIGGNLGENAGGPHCFKYGVTTNYITGLEVVLADGRAVRVGGRALDYPEYDLCGVLVGSEGTLAIATHAYLRLIRNPPGVKTMMVAFNSEEQAGEAVSAVIAAGLVPATLEMMDQRGMRIIEAYAPVGLPITAGAVLIVEVDGYPASLDAQMEEVADILTAHGGFDLKIARSEAERTAIWYGRKSFAGALARLAPNFYLVDITVPRSRLADTLAGVTHICDGYGLTVGHVFHAGDGNLHPAIVFDARDQAVANKVFTACDEIVALCIERDGSITGEHGVGMEKRKYMPLMYSGAELSAMTDLKTLFDPATLLNPGKIFPADLPPVERQSPRAPSGATFAPATAQEAASGLAGLAAAGKRVRIGSATQGDPGDADVWLSTAQFGGVKAFAPDDLYITVGAATPLAAVHAFLADRGMQAPLVSPWPDATIGGLVAANVNSPQRMRYGGLRDMLLATTVALADGRVIRAGRPVVKNVAGYDLPKLMVGSHGTLGVLTDITLKLFPQPRSRRTVAVPVDDAQQGLAWAAATVPVWMTTTGVVLCRDTSVDTPSAPYKLTFTMEGVADDLDAEQAALQTALTAAGAPQASPADIPAAAVWAKFAGAAGDAQSLVRIGVPPGKLAAYWQQLAPVYRTAAAWCFDVGNHLLYGRIQGDAAQTATWLDAVRVPALSLGGYAAVMDTAWPRAVDLWGYAPAALEMMQKLKTAWDPAHILNPGDFIAG